jgi:hypothetical protein
MSFGLMLEKLYSLGITGQSLAIISSLIYGRNFDVTFKAVVSVLFAIKSGVRQGGVISAILFNIFVRNLPFIINYAKLFQYADYCCLKMSIFNCDDQKSLQTDLNNIQKWSSENKLKLNASKSVHLRFTKRKNLNIDNYVLNDEMIPIKSSHKHLGQKFNNNLSFSEQTEYIVNNCQKKWGFLKKLCKYANHEIFLRLYKTYLLSLLEYANLCWIPSNIQNAKIESVERHISKFICYKKAYLICHTNKDFKI